MPGWIVCFRRRWLCKLRWDCYSGHDCWDPPKSRRVKPTPFYLFLSLCHDTRHSMQWCEARLVTSYAVLGSAHGYSANILAHTFDRVVLPGGITRDESWDALVTAAKDLIISCKRTYTHTGQQDVSALGDFFRTSIVPMCKHVKGRVGSDGLGPFMLDHLGAFGEESAAGCRVCYTDWLIASHWERCSGAITPAASRWPLTITTYQDLGPCRSLGEHKWESVSRLPGLVTNRTIGAARLSWEAERKGK